MGGSRSGFFSGRVTADDLAKRTRQAEKEEYTASFETEVASFLANQLADFNNRDSDAVKRVFDYFKDDLADEFEGTIDLRYGGSVAKHTYVDGISDVDVLVLMNRSALQGKSPKELQKAFADSLRAKYGRDAVSVGQLAVAVTKDGNIIQFLPALRDGNKFKIASSDGKGWAQINPERFASKLSKLNQQLNRGLVPCIKIAKAIVSTLPEQRQLSGYHIESLAIQIFEKYNGTKTPKAMVSHFFQSAAEQVRNPIRDSTGQSRHVDDYLGDSNSLERKTVSDSLSRIARRMQNADGARSIEAWMELFTRG